MKTILGSAKIKQLRLKPRRTMARPLLYLCLVLMLAGCATTDSGITRGMILIPKSYEVALGRSVANSVIKQYGLLGDEEIETYVDEVGQRLVQVCDRQDLEYSFQVLDSPMVNAFACPGGFIFVTRGLLERADNEAELATILGHELGHVNAYHSVKRLQAVLGTVIIMAIVFENSEKVRDYQDYVTIAWQLIMLGYSRLNEYQADQLGLYYSAHAGYDSFQMVPFFEKLKEEHGEMPRLLSWLSTHPRTSDRIERVPAVVAQYHLNQNADPELGTERYQRIVRKKLDGNLEYDVRDVFHLMLDAFRAEEIDEFMKYIDPNYNANGEDYDALRYREERFFEEYDNIGIELENVDVHLKGNRSVLTYDFVMSYSRGEEEEREDFTIAGKQRLTYRRAEEEWLLLKIENI